MNNQLKNKILKEIKQNKDKVEAIADKNLSEALKDKQFEELYTKIRSLQFQIAKKDFLNQNTLQEKTELTVCKKDLEQVLETLKLSKNDFVPQYDCKLCKDTGVIENKYCKCFYKKLNKAIINNMGIIVDSSHTFENANFKLFDAPEKIEKIYKKMQDWCDVFGSSKYKNILISGSTGVGKTYLIESICNKLLESENEIKYYTAFALSDLFLKYRSSFSENRVGMLDDVLQSDVLIIDDFGSEPKLKDSEEYFYLLFNERLSKNLSTIVTTNLTADQILLRYGERTFSRLFNKANSISLKIENSDIRLKK